MRSSSLPRLIWTSNTPSGSFKAPYLVELRSNDSTIDKHFITIDDEVFIASTFIRPKQGSDELL
jgi:hypothetical protein